MPDPLAVTWPTSSNPGFGPGEGNGRLLNCYPYKDGPDVLRWKPFPGLDVFSTLSDVVRGWSPYQGGVAAVVGNTLVSIDAAGGVYTYEGQVGGSGPVTMEINNAAPPVLTICSTSGAYILSGNAVARYPDSNLGVVNSVAFLDGYFIWTSAARRIVASSLDSTVINGLSFATAESKPDTLLRGIVRGQQFFAMGSQTIEVWQDAGTSPFPLARSYVIPIGLLSPWAVAGNVAGWGGPLMFVAADNTVRMLDGYNPVRVSTEYLERIIGRVADKNSLRACVYTFGGNAIFSLSCDAWTWDFNVTTQSWSERQSYGLARWRGDFSIQAFGKWIVSDYFGTTIYAVNPDSRKENADPVIWGMDSTAFKKFPIRMAIAEAAFDFVLGEAPVDDINPKVMFSWSHDGGAKWAMDQTRTTGSQGRAGGKIILPRLGLTSPNGVMLRFRASDSAYTSFAGATIKAAGRA